MKKETAKKSVPSKEEERAKTLLAKKQGEIHRLREELAGREEVERLQSSLLAYLVLAVAGEAKGVSPQWQEEMPTVFLSKKGVSEALKQYYAHVEDAGNGYSIFVSKRQM